ncbi:MAG: hypothetical protein KDI79_08370 [Anaerolineae bacterium]|nr:hypothetical protein [Anaerolineae bacterium]
MSKRSLSWLVIILIVITASGCGCTSKAVVTASPTPTTSVTTPPSRVATRESDAVEFNAADQGLNLLVAVEGEVRLKRRNWSDFFQTDFGVAVRRGDLLHVPADAAATLLCDNLRLWTVPAGPAPTGLNGCPRPAEPDLVRRGVKIASTRGGDSDIPYLISPRSTKLLDSTPTLRWHAPPGASRYTVQVFGGNLTWTAKNVTETRLVYPGKPSLEPGIIYQLTITDDMGHSSQDEGAVGLSFRVLSSDEAAEVEARRQQIAGLGLGGVAEAYAIAQYYAGQDLLAEATDMVERLVETGNDQAAIHQTLAEMYAQTGLLLPAQARYRQAIKLAERQHNIEILADSQAQLGEILIRLGNVDAGLAQLTQAKMHYETLGETQRIADIEQSLKAFLE